MFQRYATGSLDLDDAYFLEKWQQCANHVRQLELAGGSIDGCVVAELGTGWFPITPVGLALAGAGRVLSIDRHALLQRPQLVHTLEHYRRHLEAGTISLPDGSTPDDSTSTNRVETALALIDRVLVDGLSLADMVAALRIELLVTDARDVALPDDEIDLFVSNNTLEHIPADVLPDIFTEFRRIGKPTSIMCHFVDMADHYVTFDRSITVYNFLRYSDQRWRWFNNDLQFVNRLRLSDFVRMHRETGWKIIETSNLTRPLAELRSIPLAAEFGRYDEDDLLVYATWLTSQPAPG